MRYPTILLALLCVACGSYSANVPTIKPYKMDIQQGNVVTSKMMMQLRPGMSKSQVRFIMGTPLLIDSFHADRWDYFYQMRKEGKIIEQRRVMLEFEGDTLARVRGDVVPAGSDATAQPGAAVQPKSAKAAPKDKGLLDKLKFWDDDDQAATKTQPEPAGQAKAAPAAITPQPAADEPADKSAPVEAPLPPLMDEAMQPKPESEQAAPQQSKAAPAPTSKPADAPKAASSAKAATAEKTPAAKSPPQAESRAMTAPQPPKDLPPEDAPDFFEKMLEKIGF